MNVSISKIWPNDTLNCLKFRKFLEFVYEKQLTSKVLVLIQKFRSKN